MLKILLILTPFVGFGQSWMQLQNYPSVGFDDGVAFTIGDRAYVGTGMNSGFSISGSFFAYNATINSWEDIADLPVGEERQYATAISHNGKGYVIGGINSANQELNDIWEYDPVSDLWTEKTSLPGIGRSGSSCFVLSDTIFLVGGKESQIGPLNHVYAYSISNDNWTQMNNMPFSMWRGVGFTSQGMGFAGLGQDVQNAYNQLYRYIPSNDQWLQVNGITMTDWRYTGYTVIQDELYLCGGEVDWSYSDTLLRVNLQTNQVTPLNSFPACPRRGASTFTIQDRLYMVGGLCVSGRTNEFWVSDGVTELEEISSTIPVTIINDVLEIQENDLVNFYLFSSDGRVVLSGKDHTYNVHFLNSGVYFYRLETNSGNKGGKLLF